MFIIGKLFIDQGPVFQRVDNAIYRINHYPVDNTYPLDSDLSGGYSYPLVEQPGPERDPRKVAAN